MTNQSGGDNFLSEIMDRKAIESRQEAVGKSKQVARICNNRGASGLRLPEPADLRVPGRAKSAGLAGKTFFRRTGKFPVTELIFW